LYRLESAFMLVDTHAHLDMPPLKDTLDQVLTRARQAGISRILSVGSDMPSSREAVRISGAFPEVFAAVGLHPHEALQPLPEVLRELTSLLQEPKVAALGEIGLDYHYEHAPKGIQEEVFRAQIEAARVARKPVVVHVREAHARAAAILKDIGRGELRGVIHCYTGTAEEVTPYLDLGFLVSFAGIVTFKKALEIQRAAERVPLDRLLVETDSPYLAPVPLRGRSNEPCNVIHTARKLAEIKRLSFEELAFQTTSNAWDLFQLDSP